MVAEVVGGLNCRPGRLYVDGTIGEGGHAVAILDRIAQEGELVGLDRNPVVLEATARRLAPYTSRFFLFPAPFSRLGEILAALGRPQAAGILLDLGLSSYLLECSGRGFSFRREEPLDMRYNPAEPLPTAAELLNTLPEAELARIFWEYGEEPRARQVAKAVVEARRRRPLSTTGDLLEAIHPVLRPRPGSRRHPATRIFQALRMAVNRELEELEAFLTQAPAWLEPGGRLVILSYHSLEDRLVKQHFQEWERQGLCRRLTKKPLRPTAAEVRANPRARTARLRIAEKL